jgi:hypothetical protein
VSKAFSKSINSKRPGISSSSNLSIKSYISLVHSPIYLPFKNPFCVSLIIFRSIGFILFAIQADADGFTVEFYKFFWNDIKIPLVKCLNESLDNGKFSVSQRQGLITCIPKEFLKCKITLTFNNFLFSRFCYKWIVTIKEKVNMGFIDNRLSARV